MRLPLACFGLSFVLVGMLVAACGGSIATTSSDPNGTGAGSDGSSTKKQQPADGTSGDTSSSSTSSSSSGGSVCTATTVSGDRACVPGRARENQPIQIDIDGSNSCIGCGQVMKPCKVQISGTKINVSMSAQSCGGGSTSLCDASCMFPSTKKCTIPPLAPGSYTVEVTGETTRLPMRELVVVSNNDKDESAKAQTSCELIGFGQLPPPANPLKYSTSCSVDDDCARGATTATCEQPCACPNIAIAKSAQADLLADERARLSQCRTPNEQPLCHSCFATKVTCKVEPNALTGTCEIKPNM